MFVYFFIHKSTVSCVKCDDYKVFRSFFQLSLLAFSLVSAGAGQPPEPTKKAQAPPLILGLVISLGRNNYPEFS
ncbi:hypothetical protein, partial [Chryseobacterium sp. C3]|uniref:hypothetical protein n=1 Tax=Chryseobacterium sp. C3 TaxID=2761532 RepID=UPI001E59D574